MTWELILFLAAAINGLILSLMFLVSDSKRKRFLGLYLFMFSITIIHYVNFWGQIFNAPTVITWLFVTSNWFMPFAFYYYIKKGAKLKYLPYHLIPALIFTVYWVTVSFLIQAPAGFVPIVRNILPWVKIVLFVSYGIVVVKSIKFNAINGLFFLAYTSFIIGQIAYFTSLYMGVYTLRLDYIICAGFVLLTYGITYFGEYTFIKEKVRPKYSSSSLTKEDGDYLVQKINSVLEQNKYYKDPDFNLSSFAEKLGVPKYRISQALNAFSEKSFSELINEFRVEEAKNRLLHESSSHLKLEAIGEEAGFRNKVSFYKNFKKLVGSSPGEFREEHMQKSA
ncbi:MULTISPECIES: helix-turn-helix domain-containing protein [unclassified Ekhidna]|uniref:helix-turn-helix domain-containing protein n=1 Tax=unclassified Ekhidna TaxID=2632188 RepID=UPI0032E04B9E